MVDATKTAKPRTTRPRRTRQQAPARKQEPAEAAARKRAAPARTATVNLPFVTAEFRVPDIHLPKPHVPSRGEVSGAMNVAKSSLPKPERLAFYTGLGVLAVVGAIEWPVAAAIGVGTVIAQRAVRARRKSDEGWPAGMAGEGGRSGGRGTA